ncbi:unnamed protein product [Mortierella alpina]
MTKRESPSNSQDVPMSPSEVKKVKVDTWAYPQDEYTLTSELIKNSKFEILYMATRARGETPRLLLEYIGANYVSVTPAAWPKGKADTPFGRLPVLSHIKPDGSIFTVPEVSAMTRYLARLAGLTGDTVEEDATIDAVFSCAEQNVLEVLMAEVWMKPDPTAKGCAEEAFKKFVPLFDGLERYLEKNGSNGYLIREKTTYAEFPWYDWMSYLFSDYSELMNAFVSETVRPACYKLYKRFEANPRIQAYIDGGRWKHRPASPFRGLYSAGFIAQDWERSHEFYTKTLGFVCVLSVQPKGCPEGSRYMEFKVDAQDKTKFTVYSHGESGASKDCQTTGACGISLSVRSVQETHDQLVAKGVKFSIPPPKRPGATWLSSAILMATR